MMGIWAGEGGQGRAESLLEEEKFAELLEHLENLGVVRKMQDCWESILGRLLQTKALLFRRGNEHQHGDLSPHSFNGERGKKSHKTRGAIYRIKRSKGEGASVVGKRNIAKIKK